MSGGMTPSEVRRIIMTDEGLERKIIAVIKRCFNKQEAKLDKEDPMRDMMAIKDAEAEYGIPMSVIRLSIDGGWVDGGIGWVSRSGMEDLRQRRVERFGEENIASAPTDLDALIPQPLPHDAMTYQEGADLLNLSKQQLIGHQTAKRLSRIEGHPGFVLKEEVIELGRLLDENAQREARRKANSKGPFPNRKKKPATPPDLPPVITTMPEVTTGTPIQ